MIAQEQAISSTPVRERGETQLKILPRSSYGRIGSDAILRGSPLHRVDAPAKRLELTGEISLENRLDPRPAPIDGLTPQTPGIAKEGDIGAVW